MLTRTADTVADPFISAQNLVDRLGRGDASDDGIVSAVESACAIVRQQAEQVFTEETNTLTLDGTGTDAIVLPQLPVSDITSVSVDGTAVSDYVLRDDGVLIRTLENSAAEAPSYARWPEGRQNVEVRCTTGYATADFPLEVMEVALQLAIRLADQQHVAQETIGPVSVRYTGAAMDLTAGEKAILRKARPR